MSDAVIIQAYGFDRFTGEISDLTITHLSTDPPTAITTVNDMGNLAKLGLRETTDTSYPHETVRERAEKILTDGGLTFLNGGNDVLELHSLNSAQTELKPVLDALACWGGGAIACPPPGWPEVREAIDLLSVIDHPDVIPPIAELLRSGQSDAITDRGLITNARCLSEGVDVPDIDCVLFADPRRSARWSLTRPDWSMRTR
jgi:hypothetical protein